MALTWTDKQNNVDIVDANDVNSLAQAIKDNETAINDIVIEQTYNATSTNAQSGLAVAQAIAESIGVVENGSY